MAARKAASPKPTSKTASKVAKTASKAASKSATKKAAKAPARQQAAKKPAAKAASRAAAKPASKGAKRPARLTPRGRGLPKHAASLAGGVDVPPVPADPRIESQGGVRPDPRADKTGRNVARLDNVVNWGRKGAHAKSS